MELPLASLVNERLAVVAERYGNLLATMRTRRCGRGFRQQELPGVRRNRLPFEFRLRRALSSNILEPLNGAFLADEFGAAAIE
jgi:hypothetical protein